MSRKPSSGDAWAPLLNLVGGVAGLCESLGISQTTFYRASRGIRPFPPDKLEALEILCDLYDVANPIPPRPKARSKDLAPLRMLGEALERGFPAGKATVGKLKMMYPEEQLLELAGSDGTPPNVLRAVTAILESE